jgi:site-specific DNA recombinase
MIAAIYARKSTEQPGVSEKQKSVALQEAEARDFAAQNGWTVADAHVYKDDAISGAEFVERPELMRLMNVLKPQPPFQVLVMMDLTRLGREMIVTNYSLLQIVRAGVQVWFYGDKKQATLDSPIDKIMQSLTGFADELARERARVQTRDAMRRKARAGYVTGGACFGYRNVHVVGADGKRSHVTREILESEAEVIRRIFRMCADGIGLTTIAKTLNDEHAPCPRSQQGRPKGWGPSTVREVLYRVLYRGVLVWNQTTTKDVRGTQRQVPNPESEWLRVPVPHLRIVPDELWEAVRERLDGQRRRYLRLNNGRVLGRPPAVGTKYLLSGLLTCGMCGSSLEARTRSHGRQRVPFYGCAAHHRKGATVCRNNFEIPMADADNAVLSTIESRMLDPQVIERIIAGTLAQLQVETTPARRSAREQERADIDAQLARLAEGLASGGELGTILAAIRDREAKRDALDRAIALLGKPVPVPDARTLRAQIEARVRDWRGLLRKHVEQGQQLLRRVIVGRLMVYPQEDPEGRYYTWRGQGTWSRLLAGVWPQNVPSPTGFEPVFRP